MALNPKRARKARKQVRKLRRQVRRYETRAKRAKRFDPTAPLTGARYRAERNAAERLEFGPAQQELNQANANQAQTTADRAQYYDDWREALRASTARVNEANRQNVAATASRVDSSYAQDKAGVASRDAAASEQAAKLGRGPVQSNEGARAVEAQRSQGNQSLANLRGQAANDTKYMELRGVNAAQAKTEDQSRQQTKAEKLRGEAREMAAKRGAFRTEFRRTSRKDEREWLAIRKEFGLEKYKAKHDVGDTKADRRLERRKLRTQKRVASIYSSADKAGARAQIRVAKLQLDKGKISKRQFRRIVNVYRGLPEKGHAPAAKNGKSGSTANLQGWEIDKVDTALRSLRSAKATEGERRAMIDKLVKAGVPARLARIAWHKYAKGLKITSGRAKNPRGAYG